ncbi:hypothetical protein BCR44DRAFT_1423848, partial [Catenaria anguillulae PL171]
MPTLGAGGVPGRAPSNTDATAHPLAPHRHSTRHSPRPQPRDFPRAPRHPRCAH